MTRLAELPKGYALCPMCRERAYRDADVGMCSKCRGSIAPDDPSEDKKLRRVILGALKEKNKSQEMSAKEPWKSIGADNEWERRRESVAAKVGACVTATGSIEPPFKISCVVPFDKRLSKNAQKTPFKGRMILTADARSSSTALVESLRRCITGRPRKVKTLVSIRVMKPNHRMDAVNFVDVVCDCVQKASGLNDRFYSLAVDWEIDKANPRIEIEVGQ